MTRTNSDNAHRAPLELIESASGAAASCAERLILLEGPHLGRYPRTTLLGANAWCPDPPGAPIGRHTQKPEKSLLL